MLRLLTIKATKIPANKQVKGAHCNIFGHSQAPNYEVHQAKKKETHPAKKEKTEADILVPELVLTIRPLRKA
jgi:hypothetical protein